MFYNNSSTVLKILGTSVITNIEICIILYDGWFMIVLRYY